MGCYRIINGELYNCNELYHYGVKGMKWGRRKARPITSNVRVASRNKGNVSDEAARAQRKQKIKKAAIVGTAVVGTALAAYGTYKLSKYIQAKRQSNAMKLASDYIDKNVLRKFSDTTFQDGTRMMQFKSNNGIKNLTTQGSRDVVGKQVGQYNAKVIATGRQMYKDATNTKLDRGLAKIVNAGDKVGDTAKRVANSAGNAAKTAAKTAGNAAGNAAKSVGNTAKSAVNKARNTILDVVDPIYENVPVSKEIKTLVNEYGGETISEITRYAKRKIKR